MPAIVSRTSRIAYLGVLLAATGCGGSTTSAGPSSSTPSAPTLTATPPTGVQFGFVPTVSSTDGRITWNAVSGASYIVELGRTSGVSDIGSFEISDTTYTAHNLPVGRVLARVKSRVGGSTSASSNEVSIVVFDFRDYIEAVFLGTGPLTPTDGNHGCSATGYMRGFARGMLVTVLVSTTVSADKLAAIRTTMDQVADATAGAIQVTFVQTSNSDPIPSRNQVTSTTTENAGALGCASNNGCTIHTFVNLSIPGLFFASRALQPASQSPNAYAHDPIGHGVLGLCHPDGDLIGGASLSLMSAGIGVFSSGPNGIADRLTPYDLTASRAVYQAGLEAGARRPDFVGAGLVRP